MRRVRHNQMDLFDEAIPVTELRSDLRAKLTPLLQALLAEAGLARYQANRDSSGEESVDDQDHA